ncbi:hypothetical protein KM043_010602 [Ampulex compressa]|nr:hypothetical protein KM043_010602 [Ampulex compressa]
MPVGKALKYNRHVEDRKDASDEGVASNEKNGLPVSNLSLMRTGDRVFHNNEAWKMEGGKVISLLGCIIRFGHWNPVRFPRPTFRGRVYARQFHFLEVMPTVMKRRFHGTRRSEVAGIMCAIPFGVISTQEGARGVGG